MVLESVKLDLTAEQAAEKEAVIQTAHDLMTACDEFMSQGDGTMGTDTPPGLHTGDCYTAEERCRFNARTEMNRKKDQQIHPWNYYAGERCTGELVDCLPAVALENEHHLPKTAVKQ